MYHEIYSGQSDFSCASNSMNDNIGQSALCCGFCDDVVALFIDQNI